MESAGRGRGKGKEKGCSNWPCHRGTWPLLSLPLCAAPHSRPPSLPTQIFLPLPLQGLGLGASPGRHSGRRRLRSGSVEGLRCENQVVAPTFGVQGRWVSCQRSSFLRVRVCACAVQLCAQARGALSSVTRNCLPRYSPRRLMAFQMRGKS